MFDITVTATEDEFFDKVKQIVTDASEHPAWDREMTETDKAQAAVNRDLWQRAFMPLSDEWLAAALEQGIILESTRMMKGEAADSGLLTLALTVLEVSRRKLADVVEAPK